MFMTPIDRKYQEYKLKKLSNLQMRLKHTHYRQHTLQAIWVLAYWKNWFVFGRFGKSENRA